MKLNRIHRSLVASVAVLCLLVVSGCDSGGDGELSADAPAVSEATYEAGEELTLQVPSMHCPFACWPKVEETLAKQEGVEQVVLAEQQDENAIDNPQVHVKLNGKFQAGSALEALASAGFDDATVVKP